MSKELLKDRLAHKLIRMIHCGIYPVGTLLPGEIELMNTEKVSRHTVRAALQELENSGMISRTPHVGTRVISKGNVNSFEKQLSSFSDLARLATHHKRYILKAEEIVISKERAQEIMCAPGETMIRFTMIREGQTEAEPPIAWTDEYVSRSFQELVTEAQAQPQVLMIDLIAALYGKRCVAVRQIIEATELPEETAVVLKATPGETCLRIFRRYLDASGKTLLTTISYHPGKRYAFSLNVAINNGEAVAG